MPVLGAVLLLISSNSGVFGSSRIAYAMAATNLLPSIFQRVHARFRTPMISIVVFTAVARDRTDLRRAAVAAVPGDGDLYAQLFNGESGLDFLADLYAFGAATSYSFVFVALDRATLGRPAEPAQVQDSVQHSDDVPRRACRSFRSLPSSASSASTAILVFTLITHPIGRIAGPSWIVLGIILYFIYRARKRLPLLGSRKHDWRGQQVEILRRAGELELMDEYIANVRASDERRAKRGGAA